MDKMFNAFFGTVAPIFGVITSLQDDVEWTLRIASLLIGIAVGFVSLIRLIRKL
jgi:hypothetical protein